MMCEAGPKTHIYIYIERERELWIWIWIYIYIYIYIIYNSSLRDGAYICDPSHKDALIFRTYYILTKSLYIIHLTLTYYILLQRRVVNNMCMYMYMCMCMYTYTYMHAYLSIYLSISLSLCLSLSLYIYIERETHIYIYICLRASFGHYIFQVRVLLSFRQPTLQQITLQPITKLSCCVFEACSYLFVARELMKGRLLQLLLDHPINIARRSSNTVGYYYYYY